MTVTETPNQLWTPDTKMPHTPRDPNRMGLRIITDDGSATLAADGYQLYVESDHYLIRVWHEMEFRGVVRAYERWLRGEPRDLLWNAFGLRSWDDLPRDCSGFWGPGDRKVTQESIDPLIAAGHLLPY